MRPAVKENWVEVPPTVYGARAGSYLDDPSVHQQQPVYDDQVTYETVDECTKRGQQKLVASRG